MAAAAVMLVLSMWLQVARVVLVNFPLDLLDAFLLCLLWRLKIDEVVLVSLALFLDEAFGPARVIDVPSSWPALVSAVVPVDAIRAFMC
jgi:hypothetical protein